MKIGHFHIKVGKELLKTAQARGVDDKIAADMESLQNLLKDKNLRVLLQTVCYLPEADAQKVLHATFNGKVQEITLKLLGLLANQKSLKYIGKIAEVYRRNYHQAKGIKEITIRTARQFSPQEQLAFVEKLSKKKSGQLTVKFETDASLIAGAQVYEDSYLTDYSVKNYLECLQKHLLSHQL